METTKQGISKKRLLSIFTGIFLIAILSGSIGYSIAVTGWTPPNIALDDFPSTASFVIKADTRTTPTTYYAVASNGSICWSSTNASYIINSALSSLTAGSTEKETVFLQGTFTLTNAIIGVNCCILDLSSATLNAANTFPSSFGLIHASGISKFDVTGGLIDGNKANNANLLIRGIYFYNVSDCLIQKSIIQNCSMVGVQIAASNHVKISNVQANTNGKNGDVVGAGIYVADSVTGLDSTDIVIASCSANGNGLGDGLDGAGLQTGSTGTAVLVTDFTANYNTRYGIKCQSGGGLIVQNALAIGNQYGFATAYAIANVRFYNTEAINSTSFNYAIFPGSDIVIDGFYSYGGTGIRLDGSTGVIKDIIIQNGKVTGSSNNGIYATNTTDVKIDNVIACDNAPTFAGINLTNCTNTAMSQITAYDTRATATDRQTYGITIGSTCVNTQLDNSNIYNCRWSPYSVVSGYNYAIAINNILDNAPTERDFFVTFTGTNYVSTAHGLPWIGTGHIVAECTTDTVGVTASVTGWTTTNIAITTSASGNYTVHCHLKFIG